MAAETSLAGARVLVTGGAGGVGGAVVERLARLGARVLAADIKDGRDLLERLARLRINEEVDLMTADLAWTTDVARVFDRVDEYLGGLDVLIACAGRGSGPLMEMAETDWRQVVESNLMSYVSCAQRAIERMRRTGSGGSVILVGSISVHIKAVGESVYNAGKGGVASFAETLRKELMHDDIRNTLIEPGAIGSPMQDAFSEQERAEQVREHRMLAPEHVADAIVFAATRPAGVDLVTLRIEPQIQKIW